MHCIRRIPSAYCIAAGVQSSERKFLIGRHHGNKHAHYQARLRPQARAGGGVLQHRPNAHGGVQAKMDAIYLPMLEGNASEHELVKA